MAMLPRRCLLILGLAVLGACSAGPQLPLMSPADVAGYFGYSEKPIGERRYEVTYLTPQRPTGFGEEARTADAERATVLASDLALWRAAEVALAQGFPAFTVLDTRKQVEIETRERTYYPPYYSYPYSLGYPRYCDSFERGRFPWRCYEMPVDFRGTWLQARVVLVVELTAQAGAGSHQAAETAERMRSRYPAAYAVPAAPATSY